MLAALLALTVSTGNLPCLTPLAPLEAITSALLDRYGETHQAERKLDDGRMLYLWANDGTGTWTLFREDMPGLVCAIGSGMGWKAGKRT